MLSRRRFLFLLGGATTGVWLASTGLVRLERSFVLKLAGSCSFCGKSRHEVRALVGAFGNPEQICDECLGLCCDILLEANDKALDVPRARYQPSELADDRYQALVAEALRTLTVEREAARKEALLDDLRRSFSPDRPDLERDPFRCSFCGASRRDVARLISGPRVFICDRCVGDAVAVCTHVLRA